MQDRIKFITVSELTSYGLKGNKSKIGARMSCKRYYKYNKVVHT